MHFCNFLSLVLAISALQKNFEKTPEDNFEETPESREYCAIVQSFLDLCDEVDNYSDATNYIWNNLADKLEQQSSNYSHNKRTRIEDLCKDLGPIIETLTNEAEEFLKQPSAFEPKLTIEIIKLTIEKLKVLITVLHDLNSEFGIYDTEHVLLEELDEVYAIFNDKHKEFLEKIEEATTPDTCSLNLEKEIEQNIDNFCYVVLSVHQDILDQAKFYSQNTSNNERKENLPKRKLDTDSDTDENDNPVTTSYKKPKPN